MAVEALDRIDEALADMCRRENVPSREAQDHLLDIRLILMGGKDGKLPEEPRIEVGAAVSSG